MQIVRPFFSLALPLIVLSTISSAREKAQLNTARPGEQPYVDPEAGREGYALAGESVNEARLYNFYARQADYYMQHRATMPEILPACPGLDAGLYGHWGKHNQNRHEDGRWNDADPGNLLTHVLRHGDMVVLKGICLNLGGRRKTANDMHACWDPQSLRIRAIWQGGFLKFHPFRWGSSRNAAIDGTPWFTSPKVPAPESFHYLGFERDAKRTTFKYRIGDTSVSEIITAGNQELFVLLSVQPGERAITLPVIAPDSGLNLKLVGENIGLAKLDARIGTISLPANSPDCVITLWIGKPGMDVPAPDMLPVADFFFDENEPERNWGAFANAAAGLKGTLGPPRPDTAYVVDTIPVPFDNPYQQVMQLTGIDFLPTGEALICTLPGDIWKVNGLDDSLQNVTWRRFAAGFNQPMGIHVDDDGIFVLDRGQIYRLEDRNVDDEADWYENVANDFGGYDRSHTHTFGLHRTADKTFHFTQRESVLHAPPGEPTTEQAWGVRNCMGIGGGPDYVFVGPQEGTWTPATSIIEVHRGEFYGLPKGGKAGTIASPLCFVPRGVDNSVGGMVQVTSDRWGPFEGQHVGLSYGSGVPYVILRDASGPRPQGAVVPLEGEFRAGAVRGAFHPIDGQLYVVGLDGWGDYSLQDGCFHRMRYTGKAVGKPNGFQIFANGIRVDFPIPLDRTAAEIPSNFFAHAWNYEYARRYGSPEFSVQHPASLGHDPVPIRSVRLLPSGHSLFVEMPGLEPAMQLHLRMHLTSAQGRAYKTDLFASPMILGPHFEHEGLAAAKPDKLTAITLRVAGSSRREAGKESGTKQKNEREIQLEVTGGLQYVQKELRAKAGEPLALRFANRDVMPHNWVLVKPGAARKVGEASLKMLNDPAAGEKSYVPDLPEVLEFVPVIEAGQEHVLHFKAPKQSGRYPYICTFPGHWQAMQGVMVVE